MGPTVFILLSLYWSEQKRNNSWYEYGHKHEGCSYSVALPDSSSNIANGGISVTENGDRKPRSHKFAEIVCSTDNDYF